jgi:signal recognition particle subunit SRP54
MNASRKRRVAGGSGTSVQHVNKVLKMHRQMADMMKKMGKGGLANMMGGLTGSMGGNMGANMEGGSMPQMPSLDPNNLPDLSKLGGDAPADFLKGLGLPNSGPKKK